jgi:peptide/nickel transport system substrate-binding protein
MGLFGPGTILPAHVFAKASGVDVMDALASGDQGSLRKAGAFWSAGWDLHAFDPARFPALGPYRVESVENGAATLVRNERWWGLPAQTPKIKIWPKGFTPPVAGVQVIDVGKGSIGGLRLPPDTREQTVRSLGIEQFVLSTKGPFASKRGREAFALCLPRTQLAEQFGDKAAPAPGALGDSQDSWYRSPPAPVRYAQADTAAAYRARGEASPGQPLVVRVGYLAPDAQLAELVRAVAKACEPAGIRVVDASGADFTPSALAEGRIDAALVSSDLATGAGGGAGPTKSLGSAAEVRSGEGEDVSGYSNSTLDGLIAELALTDDNDQWLELLGKAQAAVWDDMPVIPLFAQPRSVIASTSLRDLVPNASAYGAGWNMDRWSADA